MCGVKCCPQTGMQMSGATRCCKPWPSTHLAPGQAVHRAVVGLERGPQAQVPRIQAKHGAICAAQPRAAAAHSRASHVAGCGRRSARFRREEGVQAAEAGLGRHGRQGGAQMPAGCRGHRLGGDGGDRRQAAAAAATGFPLWCRSRPWALQITCLWGDQPLVKAAGLQDSSKGAGDSGARG